MTQIIQAHEEPHLSAARTLFLEYAGALGISLCFQNFDQEVASLPGDYAPPGGRLLLALDRSSPIGCGGLHHFSSGRAEMKRVYVRPEGRGRGTGKEIVVRLLEEAKTIGYRSVVLDTLPVMRSAIHLYRALGFREIEAYRDNPVEGALFMELDL